MTTRVTSALVLIMAIAANTQAAKLVVIAVNSGNGTTAGAFPPLAAGQKGFLIGVANNTPADLAWGLNPLAFQDLTFSGANLVQRLAPNSFANGDLDSPNINLRTEATVANFGDPVGGGSNFAANDSWWWNQPQTANGQTLTLQAIYTGLQGGAPGGPMTYTATYNPSGNVNPGVWRMAYIVAKGDVNISGILAGGLQGQYSYNLATGEEDKSKASHSTTLDFAMERIRVPVPEPTTLTLTAFAGLFGLAIVLRRKRCRVTSL